MKKFIFSFLVLLFVSNIVLAEDKNQNSNKEFNPTETALHHVKDSHQFSILGERLVLNLPVILWTDNGLVFFSSKEFNGDDTGKVKVEKNGLALAKYHEKIYYANATPNFEGNYLDIEHEHPVNKTPWDFSITENVFSMFLSMILLLVIFVGAARYYSSRKYNGVPKGVASVVEPIIVFIRDEIAIPNIGEKKYKKYLPFLLTIFFFIWLNNIFGLIPFFPFSANLSGNIAFTCTLALFTFIITTFSGKKNYWKHIFWAPGVPVPMKLFLAPIEFIGIFTKPFSLMIRLFANITAGHIIIISLISLIFIFKSYLVAPASIVAVVFIFLIEILVTALQAYIFTILSALYFGMAVEDSHEEH